MNLMIKNKLIKKEAKANMPTTRLKAIDKNHIKVNHISTEPRSERMARLKFLEWDDGKKHSLEESTNEELVKAINDISNDLLKRAAKKKF